ncbi:MAG: heme A synthase [Rhodospirillales bacterium]|nr:heme A synthase [Rhodospirillales bacterium]
MIVTSDPTTARNRAIALWLLAVGTMVFVMVVIGGLTRLTHSGLSMVEWKPLTGWLPPLTEAEWEASFAAYRQYPEFRLANPDMTLAGYKGIFWLEYVHRVWGRLIGLVFAVPFFIFLWRGWLDRPLKVRLAILLGLGALQGALGWYMVKSGLVDRPDVSPFRLAMHLGLALALLGLILWTIFELILSPRPVNADAWSRHLARAVAVMVFVTVLSGGLVAGLDAGFLFNSFPLMGGRFIPEGLFEMTPLYLDPFENPTTAQFNHRRFAELTVVVVLALWFRVRRRAAATPRMRRAAHAVLGVALVQAGLGITTLLWIVPVGLASLHQATAVGLFAVALWALYESGTSRH